jgi:hypothetical protein
MDDLVEYGRIALGPALSSVTGQNVEIRVTPGNSRLGTRPEQIK